MSFFWRGLPADTDVSNTSSGSLKKVTASYDQIKRRHDVWKMTSDLRRLEDVWFTSSWRHPIYDVSKTSDLRRLQDVWFLTSWRRLIYDVLKTSDLRCHEDVQFTISWRRLTYHVLKTSDYDVLKTSVKQTLCRNVVATSIQCQKKWFYFVLSEIFRKF